MSVAFVARTVKDLVAKNEFGQVKDVIIHLKDDFTLSSNPNSRKGGLVGLAAIAIGLGRVSVVLHEVHTIMELRRYIHAKCCTNREKL